MSARATIFVLAALVLCGCGQRTRSYTDPHFLGWRLNIDDDRRLGPDLTHTDSEGVTLQITCRVEPADLFVSGTRLIGFGSHEVTFRAGDQTLRWPTSTPSDDSRAYAHG